MKILNITSITELRGGDTQMYTVYNLLKNEKKLIQYILCPENSVLAEICKKENANFFTYKKNSFKLFNLLSAILKIYKNESINIIHIHDSTALNAGLIAMKFFKKSTTLLLSRKRNNPIKDKFLNRFKYSHQSIDKIICVSKAVEAVFEGRIKNKSRLLTIYDAINVQKFEDKKNTNILHTEFNLSDNALIIGNVASLTTQKDLFTFIDTAKKIKKKNNTGLPIKFIIIGEGVLKKELLKYTAVNNLKNDLIFTGFRSDVGDLLPEFDVFLITSLTEGLPLSIYEAMACGVPIVSTKAGGIPEVIINGQTGFLAELRDSTILSKSVIKIIKSPSLQAKLKINALKLVKKSHDLKTMKDNYNTLYTSFVSQ